MVSFLGLLKNAVLTQARRDIYNEIRYRDLQEKKQECQPPHLEDVRKSKCSCSESLKDCLSTEGTRRKLNNFQIQNNGKKLTADMEPTKHVV
jgi:hypothetical protein